MSRTTIRVFEHERLTIGQELRSTDGRSLRFEEPCFDAIVRFNDQHGGRYFGVGHRSVKLQHYVGYLQVGSLGIEVLPKVDRAGESEKARWHDALLHMLAVTGRLDVHLRARASVALRSANLLDVFIAEFLGEVRRLLHEGLIKSYRAIDENCTSFKGRLLVRDNVRENLVHAERFYVSHTAYDANALPNHILKTALDALSHVSLPGALHNERIALVAAFPDVDRRALDAGEIERLRFDRRTERYRRAIELAKLIILHHSPRLRAGDADLLALLFDMNALWEAYVAVILRRAAPDGMAVSSQSARLFWTAPGQRRTLRPDILVREQGRQEPLAIIDTKWKVPTDGRPADADLKQMFAYNELFRGTRAVLLYPSDREPRVGVVGEFRGKGTTCETLFVPLFERGPALDEALRFLRAQLLQSGLRKRTDSVAVD